MLNQGIVGPQTITDGAAANFRQGKKGELIVANYAGFYGEMARRGELMVLDSDSITLAAAHSTKGAAATIKFLNGFYNPVGSGVVAEILYAKVATVSGTPAGGYFYNFQDMGTGIGATVPTGTVRSALLSAAAASSVM